MATKAKKASKKKAMKRESVIAREEREAEEAAESKNTGRHVGMAAYSLADGISREQDARIRRVAKKYGGKFNGSGAGFGERDMDFDFPSEPKARSFMKELKRLTRNKVRTSYWFDTDDE